MQIQSVPVQRQRKFSQVLGQMSSNNSKMIRPPLRQNQQSN